MVQPFLARGLANKDFRDLRNTLDMSGAGHLLSETTLRFLGLRARISTDHRTGRPWVKAARARLHHFRFAAAGFLGFGVVLDGERSFVDLVPSDGEAPLPIEGATTTAEAPAFARGGLRDTRGDLA